MRLPQTGPPPLLLDELLLDEDELLLDELLLEDELLLLLDELLLLLEDELELDDTSPLLLEEDAPLPVPPFPLDD